MPWWQWLLLGWLALAVVRFFFFAWKSVYLMSVRRALREYHQAVHDRRRSRHEPWLRKQRLIVQSLLFQSGQYDEAPSPREGGRATKLNLYALESLEHWLSEHPKGMARTQEAMSKAIRIYFLRAIRGLNPVYWVSWLLFFPQKVAARIGVQGDAEWSESLRLLYWTVLASAVVLFIILFIRK
jgi:hypothetical protein